LLARGMKARIQHVMRDQQSDVGLHGNRSGHPSYTVMLGYRMPHPKHSQPQVVCSPLANCISIKVATMLQSFACGMTLALNTAIPALTNH